MSLTTHIHSTALGKAAAQNCARAICPKVCDCLSVPGRRICSAISKSSSVASKHTSSHHQIHSSATTSHSAAALAALHIQEQQAAPPIPDRPTTSQLKTLFVSSAIPMVGFGMMDNFIMIQAGGYIDATLGMKLGLATMTAAAMGQVVSDVSGVVFGGTLERFLEQLKLTKPSNLTAAQRQMPLCRNVAMCGAMLGVASGCILGASALLFVDLEAHERQKQALELHRVLTSILADDESEPVLGCEECTVYLANADDIPSGSLQRENGGKVQMKLLKNVEDDSPVAKCVQSRAVLVDNHQSSESEAFSRWRSLLCAPVISKNGNVVAVLKFRNKHAPNKSNMDTSFSDDDKRTAKILARHIAIFMEHLAA